MKTNYKVSMNSLARKITGHLEAMHPERRPVMPNGFRARRVDYSANGEMEVMTSHGHTAFVSVEQCRTWLNI